MRKPSRSLSHYCIMEEKKWNKKILGAKNPKTFSPVFGLRNPAEEIFSSSRKKRKKNPKRNFLLPLSALEKNWNDDFFLFLFLRLFLPRNAVGLIKNNNSFNAGWGMMIKSRVKCNWLPLELQCGFFPSTNWFLLDLISINLRTF